MSGGCVNFFLIRKGIRSRLGKRKEMIKMGHCGSENIRTERLRLVPLNTKDVGRYIEIAKNMRKVKAENPDYFLYTRFDYSVAPTDDDLKDAVMGLLTSAQNSVFPEVTKRLNISLKNGRIIGYIGYLHNPKEKISSDLGIFLDPKYEHKGYAMEAQKSLLADYFLNCDDQIYLTIYPKNRPSYRLNEKCGAVKIDHIEKSKYGQERDILIITRKNFIEKVFNKKFKTAQKEKEFLCDFLEGQK